MWRKFVYLFMFVQYFNENELDTPEYWNFRICFSFHVENGCKSFYNVE